MALPAEELLIASVLTIFWLSGGAIFHVLFGYPGTLFVLSTLKRGPENKQLQEYPEVALVIAAYNEEDVISEKIQNSLSIAYPDEKLNIYVFSDASDDSTDEIVRSFESEEVELIRIEGRVGKTECQNRVVSTLSEEIIVFSDADSMYEEEAIERLLTRFDADVGCVVGELRYHQGGVESESIYRRYERFIKKYESDVSSVVGGNGSIYAVKRDSYVELPRDSISDFGEPLAIVENGERVAYADDAQGWEHTGESVSDETNRRIRITTRSWHTFVRHSNLLNPFTYGLFSYQFISHSALRWMTPLFLLTLLLTNIWSVLATTSPIYTISLLGQFAFYTAAGGGWIFDRRSNRVPSVLQPPYYFVMLNYSLMIGFGNLLMGRNIVTWDTWNRD